MKDFETIIHHHFEIPFQNPVLVFTLVLSIILIAPVVLRKLKVPGIIGLIIAGLFFGPHGFNLIEKNSAVELFSTIGLLYIMFLAGLDLDINKFNKNKHKSILFGIFTFTVPLLIGFPVCYYLLGYGFETSLLTASMFSTHTLIAYPIVSRMGIVKNEAVAVAVGGTIFTDTAVMIILALISGSHQTSFDKIWIRLLISSVVFILIVAILVPYLSRQFFKRLRFEKNLHFIYVLLIVFICAFLAELSGLEPIIGAFAAGLVLNKLIPETSSLMSRLKFVGESLFIPFFLISVGMLINLGVVFNDPVAITVALTLTIVALLGKWLAAFITSKILKFGHNEQNLLFGLSSSHAAATLAIIMIGYKIEIIDEKILNGTILLILITCLFASIVSERAAKKIVIRRKTSSEEEEEVEKTSTYQKILVPISKPETMELLIDLAILLNNHEKKLPIVGLSVVEDDSKADIKLKEAKNMLEEALKHASAAEQVIDIIVTIDRNVVYGVTRVVKELSASEIVIGWPQKTNLSDMFFGKMIDGIITQSKVMVILSRLSLPLNVHKGMRIFCPPFAELDSGFNQWADRVLRMISVLNLNPTIFCTAGLLTEMKKYADKYKYSLNEQHIQFTSWEEFTELTVTIKEEELVVFIRPRNNSVAFQPALNKMLKKIGSLNARFSIICIYPEV